MPDMTLTRPAEHWVPAGGKAFHSIPQIIAAPDSSDVVVTLFTGGSHPRRIDVRLDPSETRSLIELLERVEYDRIAKEDLARSGSPWYPTASCSVCGHIAIHDNGAPVHLSEGRCEGCGYCRRKAQNA